MDRSNMDEVFTDYVHRMVTVKNRDKRVEKTKGEVTVFDEEQNCLRLVLSPIYKEVSSKNIQDISFYINEAIDKIAAKHCENIYIVAPKNEEFRKHIEIKSKRLDELGIDYMLKVVPYRLNKRFQKENKI